MKRESETFLSKEEREKYIVHIPLSKERKVSLPTNDTWQDWKHGRLQKPSHTEAYHIGSIRIEGIGDDLWVGALRASYDFVLGPVSIQANYSNLGKNVGFYINAGFVF